MVRLGAHERRGHGAADVVDDDVQTAELVLGGLREAGSRLQVVEVQRYDQGPPASRLDLGCDLAELLFGTGRDDDVGAGLGEGDRTRGPDSAARTGDHRDLPGHQETIKNHQASMLSAQRRTN
jgi:hypothetical protein